MRHGVTLRLGEFGRAALEAEARASRSTVDDLVATAVMYYLSAANARQMAWLPGLDGKPDGDGLAASELRVEFVLPDRASATMEAEALRHPVELSRLVQHAALHYLADLDAGRVAAHVLERAERVA